MVLCTLVVCCGLALWGGAGAAALAQAEPEGEPAAGGEDMKAEKKPEPLTAEERATLEGAVREAARSLNELVERGQPGEGNGLPTLKRAEEAWESVTGKMWKEEGDLANRLHAILSDPGEINLGDFSKIDQVAARTFFERIEAAGVWRLVDEGLAPGRWLARFDADAPIAEVFDSLFARGLDYRVGGMTRALTAQLRLQVVAGEEAAAEATVARVLGLARAKSIGLTAFDVAAAGAMRSRVSQELVTLGVEQRLGRGLRTRLGAMLDSDVKSIPAVESALRGEWLFMRGSAAVEIMREADGIVDEEREEIERIAREVSGKLRESVREDEAAPVVVGGMPWDGLPRADTLIVADKGLLVKDLESVIKRGRNVGLMRNRAARLVIALEDHRDKHGAYPDSLAALAPDFIAEVPTDAVSDRPFGYRLLKDDPHGRGYLLYSLWLDQEDQGGKMNDDGRTIGFPAKERGYDLVLNQPREPKVDDKAGLP